MAPSEKEVAPESWKRWYDVIKISARISLKGCHYHFRAPSRSSRAPSLWFTSHSEFTPLPTAITMPFAEFQLAPKQLWHFSGGGGYSSVEGVSFENAVLGRKTLFKKNTILLTTPRNWENELETEKSSSTQSQSLGIMEVQHPVSRQPSPFTRIDSFRVFNRNITACFFWNNIK